MVTLISSIQTGTELYNQLLLLQEKLCATCTVLQFSPRAPKVSCSTVTQLTLSLFKCIQFAIMLVSFSATYSAVTIIKTDERNKKAEKIPVTSDPGGYTESVGYGGTDVSDIGYLADLSNHCMQFIYAKCWSGAKLLNTPSNSPPYAYWVSRQGYQMLNWGNATAHSGKCGCAMTPGESCARSDY